jgi:ABC-type bacteriocin/lantibiotic exporter with double-glycine peptidase domain
MQITGAGRPDCDIKCIYELIGKEPFGETTLKDLKDAAQKLGFSANGYKLTLTDLEKITGYAILPVGGAAGTADDPQHFILVKQVVKDDVTIINTRTLKAQTIAVSELQESWKGYALVISAGEGIEPLVIEH